MYYYLNGILALATPDTAVVDCGGVGYKCSISQNTYEEIKELAEVRLYTYLNVKEDAMDLFGFSTEKEKEFFILLLSVSGVGPKAAMAVLSELSPDALSTAILSSNALLISKAQGVGAKTAQRICLELKDKVTKMGYEEISSYENTFATKDDLSDAKDALLSFGYKKSEVEAALKKCSADNTEDLIRQALKILSKVI